MGRTAWCSELEAVVGARHVQAGSDAPEDLTHDEALTATWTRPVVAVHPGSTAEVAAVLAVASAHGVPVTTRGAGTGLAGGAIPRPDGILLVTDRMNRILELDTANHVAVVQPGVTLAELDAALEPLGLTYPVAPGEYGATLGGNAATNAGGMRAVRYGVTRHHVLGLEAVLATGEVLRTGGKYVKATSGYDLTQLLVGSEGTLAVITELTLKLHPRLAHRVTLLAPFPSVEAVARAVPPVLASGVAPLLLEYLDALAMTAATQQVDTDLGITDEVRAAAAAYLLVVLESTRPERAAEDGEEVAALLADHGAIDTYLVPEGPAQRLVEGREQAFWAAKRFGADDIVDVVVPRASLPGYLAEVAEIARERRALVAGAGHAGDGNVHLSVFQPDPVERRGTVEAILAAGVRLGGEVSAEHGIGTEKRHAFDALEDPVRRRLRQAVKAAFDPDGILNPGVLVDPVPAAGATAAAAASPSGAAR